MHRQHDDNDNRNDRLQQQQDDTPRRQGSRRPLFSNFKSTFRPLSKRMSTFIAQKGSALPTKEWRYRRDVLSLLLKWSLGIAVFVVPIYMVSIRSNPEWATTILLAAFSLFLPVGCWCLYLLRKKRRKLAAWLYLVNAVVLTAIFMLFMPESFLLVGLIGFMLFIRTAAFLETLRTTMILVVVCAVLYLAIFALRSFAPFPQANIDVFGNFVLNALPVAAMVLFAVFDHISARYLSKVIAQSEEARQDLARSNKILQRQKRALKKSQKYLTKLTAELEKSNKELEDFAYIASHDLKEPLRGIHNYSKFLLEDYGGKFDADGEAKLKTLATLAQRMEDLISSLLYYSRVGRTELSVAETDLNKIVDDVLASLKVTLEEKEVEVRIPRPLPIITCDTVRVHKVFYNLVTNAIKYNDKPRKWLEIAFEAQESKNNEAQFVFRVRDNGIGIREKHREKVFQIFKRLHGRDKFGGGTGAGLTITRKIVERHGGRLWVESTYGEGTTFYFTLHEDQINAG